MGEPSDTFKRTPKRKPLRGKSVTVSAETKAAYEAMIRESEERAKMTQHLPPDMIRR